ncbi:MAG: hypothetical protein K2H91_10945, partial [Lachnospiraceae bacterium]|nr:hypothetical protein [Lachnospiraceae bacterium]
MKKIKNMKKKRKHYYSSLVGMLILITCLLFSGKTYADSDTSEEAVSLSMNQSGSDDPDRKEPETAEPEAVESEVRETESSELVDEYDIT